jgi:nucleoid-associated protein YgaU
MPGSDRMRRYTVTGPETLEDIALRELRGGQLWLGLYAWNASAFPKQIKATDPIRQGVVLLLPL